MTPTTDKADFISSPLWGLRITVAIGSAIGICILAPLPFLIGGIGTVSFSYLAHGRHCSLLSWHQKHHRWHIQTFLLPDDKLRYSPGLKISLLALSTFALITITPPFLTAALAVCAAAATVDWVAAASFVWIHHTNDPISIENSQGFFHRFCKGFHEWTFKPEKQKFILLFILNLGASYLALSANPFTWGAAALFQISIFIYKSFYQNDFLQREYQWMDRFKHPYLGTALSCSTALLSQFDHVLSPLWVIVQSLTIVSIALPLLTERSKSVSPNII